VKSWDVAIVGGGIIGVSLARALRKHGASVLVVERGEPGREASYAAAGMLAHCDPQLPEPLQPLATASFAMYREFVHELEDESGMRVDLRLEGCIAFLGQPAALSACARPLGDQEVAQLEPKLGAQGCPAYFLPEGSVDPRALIAASLKAAKHRGIEVAFGSPATEIEVSGGRAVAVKAAKTKYPAAVIVNCCGAWAGQLAPHHFPTRPIKGQMLALVPPDYGPHGALLQYVVRAPEAYIVPRSDGRTILGSTLEDVGFDKRVDAGTIQRLHQAATNLVPELGQARMLESWAGLRPGTPDHLPILGATATPGYYVAAGHYRDGILLAPITAHLMDQVTRGLPPDFDLGCFSPARFAS
jgi:glycine oxidase